MSISIFKDPILIFSIIGAAVALAASLTKTLRKNAPRMIIAMLAVLAFLIIVVQQLVSANLENEREIEAKTINDAREEIITEIRKRVIHTEEKAVQTFSIVTQIKNQWVGKPWQSIGKQLVTVPSKTEEWEALNQSLPKGTIEKWPAFAEWIRNNSRPHDKNDDEQLLSMIIIANKYQNYRVPLLLVYLYTSSATEDKIKEAIDPDWDHFPKDDVLDYFIPYRGATDFVHFFDSKSEKLVAYAHAHEFADELLLWQKFKREKDIEDLFNKPYSDLVDVLTQQLSSVKSYVLYESDIGIIVEKMLDKKWPECVIINSEGRYFLRLENIVKAVDS